MQRLNHELKINKAFCKEKEGMEQKLSESMAQNQKLQEEVARLIGEMKKAERSKQYFLEKISKLKSRESVT